jgi:hypothetical protein
MHSSSRDARDKYEAVSVQTPERYGRNVEPVKIEGDRGSIVPPDFQDRSTFFEEKHA